MTNPLVAAPVDGTSWYAGTGVLDLAELCRRLKPVFDKADEVNGVLMRRFGGEVKVRGTTTNGSVPFVASGNAVSVTVGAAWPDS